MGFKPFKFAVPWQHATNWANKPPGSWSSSWFDINQLFVEVWRWKKKKKQWKCDYHISPMQDFIDACKSVAVSILKAYRFINEMHFYSNTF